MNIHEQALNNLALQIAQLSLDKALLQAQIEGLKSKESKED